MTPDPLNTTPLDAKDVLPPIDQETFRALVSEGQILRMEFEKLVAPMRILTAEDLKRVSR